MKRMNRMMMRMTRTRRINDSDVWAGGWVVLSTLHHL